MAQCCEPGGYEQIFGSRFARRVARRYRRHGLTPAESRMVDFVSSQGLEGASVLEIGGGVGEIHVELLRRGAARVTNLEISSGYDEQAAALLEQTGLADRVERRIVDIAQAPEAVDSADVVVLHRVVCCYPDYRRLLTAAGDHARRTLVFSHPPHNLASRSAVWLENLTQRMRRRSFRAFVHPPAAMEGVLNDAGLTTRLRHRQGPWHVVGLTRPAG